MNTTIGNNIIHSRFEQACFSDLTLEEAAKKFGTPIYIYSEKVLEENAQKALSFPNPFGLSVRYAMKACPNANVLRLFHNLGLHFDASSGYEVLRAEAAEIPSKDICLTAQELPTDFSTIISRGVGFNACSLFQLHTYAKLFPGSEVGIRFNPGLGSGHANRVNTGGPSSSFGIWKDYVRKVKEIAAQSKLKIARIHSHIGAGTDPQVWVHCAKLTLSIASEFADCHTVSLGGGFKVARIAEETPANLSAIGLPICEELKVFEKANKRKLHLEIEPGTFLTANAGVILCKIIDISDTGPEGYNFIKIDSGMSEIIRPGMYGAQHPIWIVNSEERNKKEYLVAGHCCESGDILTPSPGNPESLTTRILGEAQLGDLLAIGGAGAYCAGMSAKNYNSFPEAAEVMLKKDGKLMLIRSRQPIEQITQNEIII
jgi:diaminopimelate decarboxylase